MENNLMELWSIFDYIMPGYLLSEENLKKNILKKICMMSLKSLLSHLY